MVKPLIACFFMGCAAYLGNSVLASVISPKLACLGGIVAAVIVYAVMVLALRIITYEDCLLLPKGEKIARLLHIR